MRAASPGTVAFVVPRYGAEILGGAETHCRVLAEHLAGGGVDVEVLTTTAVDHFTWEDAKPSGTERVGGVTVHRFPVNPWRDHARWWGLHTRIGSGYPTTYADQVEWMAHSVWSEGIQAAAEEPGRYDWVVPIPYLFGTAYWAAAGRPARTAMISCLHDEPYAWLPAVRRALAGARGCLVSTIGERTLLRRVAPRATAALVGVGFEETPVGPGDAAAFCAARGIRPGYLLYAGRREEAKGLPLLFSHYRAYRDRTPGAPPLALMGSGDHPTPPDLADHVIDLGFVPDEDRAAAYAAASVLLHPSRLEALGMVLLEAWLAGTPALVNAASPVLREHCRASDGGLWFAGEGEFCEALDLMLDDEALLAAMAAGGAEYARTAYSWPVVTERFVAALEGWS
ncbi:MAG: glycosyltransferase family 4 protein [Thermoleophilia bacterium]